MKIHKTLGVIVLVVARCLALYFLVRVIVGGYVMLEAFKDIYHATVLLVDAVMAIFFFTHPKE